MLHSATRPASALGRYHQVLGVPAVRHILVLGLLLRTPIFAGSIVLIGIVLVGWVITEFVGGDLEVGSKYSHAAKNSNLLLLGLFVGLAATAYGLFTLAINRRDNNDR